MRRLITLVMALLLLCSPMAAFANQSLEQTLDQITERSGVRAYTAVAFEGEKILFSHSSGVARWIGEKSVPADRMTKYRVASISKMVSGMLVMMLCEQNALSLDGDLSSLIDKRLVNPAYPNNPITVKHLLTHTSSIVDGASYNRAISCTPFPPLDHLLSGGIAFSGYAPGEGFNYSNFGMGLAAAVVERGSNKYFHEYAEDSLFGSMGVDAGYMVDYLDEGTTVAAMPNVDPSSWGSMKRAYSNIPLGHMYLLAQGELYISAEDLAKVAMILAGDGIYDGKRYLESKTVASINTTHSYYANSSMGYGLAVQSTDQLIPGITLFGHQGNAYGTISCVFYEPVAKRGVVFLTSGANGMKLESGVYKVNHDVVKRLWELF